MREWMVFAKKERCDHYKALQEIGFIDWAKARNFRFEIGDIVYVFSSEKRKIIFKTVVVEDNVSRGDSAYWFEKAPQRLTYRLKAEKEYTGNNLSEELLMEHGFKGRRSIQHPLCGNRELMEYIREQFEKRAL